MTEENTPLQSESVPSEAQPHLGEISPPAPEPASTEPPPTSAPPPALPPLPPSGSEQQKSLLAKALEKIRFRKRGKLEKVMKLAQEKGKITNDEVQKLLRVSDATATRYLSELVKQNRLKRSGTTVNITYEPTIGSIPAI